MRGKCSRLAIPLMLVGALGACPIEQLFPEPVAMGVARLTVRNVGNVVAQVVADRNCGFASSGVAQAARFDGEIGHSGSMTLTVDHCVIDFGAMHPIDTDCNGVETLAAGRVTVSGTQTVRGHLTGDPASPVIPGGPDQVELELDMVFDNLMVRASNANNGMVMQTGGLHLVAKPHLGASASLGVCAVATKDLTLEHIRYDKAELIVDSGDSEFAVQVPTSDFGAQVGRWGNRENDLDGQLTVWDSIVEIPIVDDRDGLDPEYNRVTFEAAMACKDDLAQPLSYECKSLDGDIAAGLARLALAAFGRLADYVDSDTRCGFGSEGVKDRQVVTGTLGRPGGKVHMEIGQPCTLSFSQPTVIKTTCNGVDYTVSGSFSATGFKEVEGFNTGNRDKPIIPERLQPSKVGLQLRFSDFSIGRSDLPYLLNIRSGTLDGEIAVQLAMDTAAHACALKSSAAAMRNVRLQGADVMLTIDGKNFAVQVEDSNLAAINGRVGAVENQLYGSLRFGGTDYPLGTASAPEPLDPNYSYDSFLADDACRPSYQHVNSDAECSLYPLLGNIAARLLVHSAGAVASMVNANSECGFEDTWGVLIWPSDVQGDNGEMGSITWDIEDCWVGSPAAEPIKEDCLGTKTYTSGAAAVSASRTVRGERESQYLIVDSIVPRDPRSVTITLRETPLSDFRSYDLSFGAAAPAQEVTWHSGTLSGTVAPVTGENDKDLGTFDVATPIASFTDLDIRNAEVSFTVNGLTFAVTVKQSDIDAQNGYYLGEGNYIEGNITVDNVPIAIVDGELKSDYEQGAFDASYACFEDLVATLPSGL